MAYSLYLHRLTPAVVLTTALIGSTLPGTAAEPVASPTSPPCSAAPYRQFDFWVGEWQVHSADGVLQGTNTITSEEGRCLLVENWRSVAGGTGQSYNYYDPTDERWHQHWVSQGAIIRYTGNLSAAGAMRLEGSIHYQANGQAAPFRGTWTPLPDGSVRQHLEQYDAAGEAWQDWFVGTYTRTAAAASLPD